MRWPLREECEKRRIDYSLGVPCSFRIRLPPIAVIRADAALKLIPARAWQIASCEPGSKGDRRYAWAWLRTASPRHFLPIRRSLTKPADLAYFSCHVPERLPATLTVVEVKKLFNLATRARHTTDHHLYWSWWRHRHQARARWYHHRARLT